MQISIAEATDLAVRALTRAGMSAASARIVADHLVDANLCGHEFSSLPRVLAIVDELSRKPPPGEIRVVREDRSSAVIDGGDNVAYVVSIAAIDKAIEICRKNGVAVVTANNTWFSGRLAYYVERAARQGYVAMHTTNVTARVAPYGGIDRLMGTNPIAIAFPERGRSARLRHRHLGDDVGRRDPRPDEGRAAARGRGRGRARPADGRSRRGARRRVPRVGRAARQRALARDPGAGRARRQRAGHPRRGNFGLFFLVIDPEMLLPGGQCKARVSELRRSIAANRPMPGKPAVRVPGDGSQQRRRQALAAGMVTIDERVYQRIQELCG